MPGKPLSFSYSGRTCLLPSSHAQLTFSEVQGFQAKRLLRSNLPIRASTVSPRLLYPHPLSPVLYMSMPLWTARHLKAPFSKMSHSHRARLRPPHSYLSVPLPDYLWAGQACTLSLTRCWGSVLMAHRNPRPSRGWLGPLLGPWLASWE